MKIHKKLTIFLIIIFPLFNFLSAQNEEVWGMTSSSSHLETGAIYKVDSIDKSAKIVKVFDKISGGQTYDCDLLEASNSKFYGTTARGGKNDVGVIFEYDPQTNDYNSLFDFNHNTTGRFPIGSLIETSPSIFYGITSNGGTNNLGLLYKYDKTLDSFAVVLEFDSINFKRPVGSLTLLNDKLFWTTRMIFNLSKIASYNLLTDTATIEHTFQTEYSVGALVPYSDSVLIGFTNNKIYSFNTNKSEYIELITTNSSTSISALQDDPLIINNKVYGVSKYGGSYNIGTIFEFNLNDTSLSILHSFQTSGYPEHGLVNSNNKLYGRTPKAGMDDMGTFYEIDLNTNQFRIILDGYTLFSAIGHYPSGNLMKMSDGKIYSLSGGNPYRNDNSTIFSFDPSNDHAEKLINFQSPKILSPSKGRLHLASNDKFYGIGQNRNYHAVLFEYDPVLDEFKVLYNFNLNNQLGDPVFEVIEGTPGKIYGVTNGGNNLNNRFGSIYEYDFINDSLSIKQNFDYSHGTARDGGMIKSKNGKLYGISTDGGGTWGSEEGTIYEYDPSSTTLSPKYTFSIGQSVGIAPKGQLVEGKQGEFYGFTTAGGSSAKGAIFKYNLNLDTIIKVKDLSYQIGFDINEKLVIGSDGNIYGIADKEGTSFASGTFFKIDTTNFNLQIIHYFNSSDTLFKHHSKGSLLALKSGKIIGLMKSYTNTKDALFIYDPNRATINKTLLYNNDDFNAYRLGLTSASYCKTSEYDKISSAFTLCEGETFSLSLNNAKLNQNTHWKIYSNKKDSITSDTVGVFNFIPDSSGFYYLSSAGGCAQRNRVDSFHITLKSSYQRYDSIQICRGDNFWLADSTILNNIQNNQIDTTVLNSKITGCDSIIYTYIDVSVLDTSVQHNESFFTSNQQSASYQWLDCNNNFSIIAGETDSTFTPTKGGSYAVEIRKNECVDTSTCLLSSVGLNEADLSNLLNINPNPTSDIMNISLIDNINEGISIKVFNQVGQLIQDIQKTNKSLISISLKNEPSGLYYIIISTKSSTEVFKVIKN